MKKVWALLLAGVLAFSMTACITINVTPGGSTENPSESTEGSKDPVPSASDKETEKETEKESEKEANPVVLNSSLYGTFETCTLFEKEEEYKNVVDNTPAYVKSVVYDREKQTITIEASFLCYKNGDFETYEVLPMSTQTFTYTEKTLFELGGGNAEPEYCNIGEFVEICNYFNGLGLMLRVEDGVITKAGISS